MDLLLHYSFCQLLHFFTYFFISMTIVSAEQNIFTKELEVLHIDAQVHVRTSHHSATRLSPTSAAGTRSLRGHIMYRYLYTHMLAVVKKYAVEGAISRATK